MRVLITGGAGFIGSHTADGLLDAGHEVRIFDNLDPQIHGVEEQHWPSYINKSVECVFGDVRDKQALGQALSGVQIVFHFAAATGVGQSMYQIDKYFDVNVQGTANLIDILANKSHQVQKLIVASSRAVYGEGAYACDNCGIVLPDPRLAANIEVKQWEVTCPRCHSAVTPIPTKESSQPKPTSMYAITKLTQEYMSHCFGKAYGLPVITLRYFNVYGPRQSFQNPYTGIITNFLSRLLNGKAPSVYEDGKMTRDFVHISDVAQANMLAMEKSEANGHTINIGSGVDTSILTLAELLCEFVSNGKRPQVVGIARIGDIRHCTADLEMASSYLSYTPRMNLKDGLQGVIQDAMQQEKLEDRSAVAERELSGSGLLK